MAEALKDRYHDNFMAQFHKALSEVVKTDKLDTFRSTIKADPWEKLELKERMHVLKDVLATYLSAQPKKACQQILELSQVLTSHGVSDQGLEYIFLPELVLVKAENDVLLAMDTFHELTKFVSCEFAIRPFIAGHPSKCLSIMQRWSQDEDLRVRRLSSEGCRPRLPWGIALKALQKDPQSILPILENLKNDPSEYVRKSVANNINDISKDHPKVVLSLAKKWQGQSTQTDWIIKHGLRTLLKAGNSEALEIIGVGPNKKLHLENLVISEKHIHVGDYLEMEYRLLNQDQKKSASYRLEYAIYFLLKNGSHFKKVFKVREGQLQSQEGLTGKKKHSFKPITTRTYYKGIHKVSMIVNGKESESIEFELL